MKRRKVLLLGNGLNRTASEYSWEELMQQLLAFAGQGDAISLADKPFPLLYEEIYLRWVTYQPHRELALKRKIRDLLRNTRSSDLHAEVLETSVDEILTTNYDYNLEVTLPGGLPSAPYVPPVKGSKYSILRRRKAGDKLIWHIHGEMQAPGTILLGYEQYAGYLQTIRNYVINGLRYKNMELVGLNYRLKKGDDSIQSWVDHFFLSDVYILGLSLDFVEMHLWWILNFRARLLPDDRYALSNKIVFLYPAHITKQIKPRIDLLCACGVSCIAVPVVDNDWKQMYRTTLEYIEKQ